MKDGRIMGLAPFGYQRAREKDGKPTIIPNENAKFVLQAFEMIATGVYNAEEVRGILNEKGMSIQRNRF